MEQVLSFLLKNLSYLLVLIALVGPIVHFRVKKIKARREQVDIALSYILFFGIGLQGLYAAWGHAFMPVIVAKSIGWVPSPPFQFELAFANLAIGVLGLMSPWKGWEFRLATIISVSIFLLGCAYGHARDIYLYTNYAPNNAGLVLFMDTVFPLVLMLLVFLSRKGAKR